MNHPFTFIKSRAWRYFVHWSLWMKCGWKQPLHLSLWMNHPRCTSKSWNVEFQTTTAATCVLESATMLGLHYALDTYDLCTRPRRGKAIGVFGNVVGVMWPQLETVVVFIIVSSSSSSSGRKVIAWIKLVHLFTHSLLLRSLLTTMLTFLTGGDLTIFSLNQHIDYIYIS